MERRKFTFDTHFGPAAEDSGAILRSRKSYSADEIEAMKALARQEGLTAGDVRANEAMAAAIGQVAAGIVAAIAAMDEEVEAIRAEAARLAFAAAKALARAALASAPESEIEEALRVALAEAIGEPRVVVKVAPSLVSRIAARAASIVEGEGYEGRVQFAADPAISGGDCRIEWKGGGVERALQTIETALQELIARRFPARSFDHSERA